MTTVGFLGGGQLARMMALAGIPLGIASSFLDPASDACAAVAGELIVDAYDSPEGLDRPRFSALLTECDEQHAQISKVYS